MEQSEITREELEQLLALAHVVVTGTTQDVLRRDAAFTSRVIERRQKYWKARLDIMAAHGILLTSLDSGGCTCPHQSGIDEHQISDSCMYHYAARLQPDNHRIPWNCPTYYDGCNCEPRQNEGEEDD